MPDSTFEINELKNPFYTGTQSATLQNIAAECPYEYGPAVFMARVMLSQNDSIPNLYYNECEAVADTGSGKWDGNDYNEPEAEQLQDLTDNIAEFVLYPNPNDGNMYLEYRYLSETANFELYDVTGRKAASYSLRGENGKLNINEKQLTSGVYFYRIVNEIHKFRFGKVIISK